MTIPRNESGGSFASEGGNHNADRSAMEFNRGTGSPPILLEGSIEDLPLMFKKKKAAMGAQESKSRGGVTLAWHDLSVYVPAQKAAGLFSSHPPNRPFKRVLHNVSGIVYPGSLMAIMGASGAGKTTLMNVLANKAEGKVVMDGEIRVNGQPMGKFISQMSGFVYQQDLFTGTLTVSEHLHFMARMKLDRRLSNWERTRRVEELMTELGLMKCAETRIGIPNQLVGLSGGERKRLAFASEVLTDPPLLLCDEPTTGLDSYSAQKIVGMMQNLASKGKTVICTIHQPSSQVFSMFDQLLLLAEGRTAYMGSSIGALNFMKNLGFVCPEQFNPADYYIRTLAVTPGREDESRSQIREICEAFSSSEQAREIDEKVRAEIKDVDYLSVHSSNDSLNDQSILGFHTRRPLWITQTYWLTWRNFVNSYRNPQVHLIRTIQKIVIALIVGICYMGIKLNQIGVQDIQGAIFMFVTENTFPNLYGVLHVFPYELPLFVRENRAGLYRCDSYYLSKMISLLPGFIMEPIIFATITYWMAGLRPEFDAFLTTCFVVILTANVAAACGCFFSAAFENISMAITCLIPFDYIMMITGGLFINVGTLPPYISWARFTSWFLYSFEAMSIKQWENVTSIPCDAPPGGTCLPDGKSVLDRYSFAESHFVLDFAGLGALYCTFHILAFLAVVRRSRS